MSAKERTLGKKKEFPHIFAILLVMIAIALVATWIIPSGSYQRVKLEGTSRMIVDPNTFAYTEKTYLSPFRFLTAITDGMTGAALVAFSILIIGGSWEIINSTGAIKNAIAGLSKKFSGKEYLMFPFVMFVFAFIASIIGAGELNIVYMAAMLPIVLSLGFDTLTAAACVEIGAVTAFSVSVFNPFTVGLGQQIYGIQMYSGAWYRIILQVIFFAIGAIFVVRYAKKVKLNPQSSMCYEESEDFRKEIETNSTATTQAVSPVKTRIIGIILILILALLVFGVVKWGWYLNEINGMFILAAALAAIIAKVPLNDACRAFGRGASNVVGAALVCGLSGTIANILTAGGIIDVVIHALAIVVLALPKSIALIGIFIAQWLFNFLVNSGSGQFIITMPIMAPLGDLAGLAPNAVILASEMGDGITNMLFPTSGVLMAVIAQGRINYPKWVKFIMPYIGIITGAGCVALIVAQLIGYV